jgi:2-oxo-3-hexenedioate decarboxylase
MTIEVETEAVAREVIASLSDPRQFSTFSSRPGGLTVAQAYRVTPLLRAAFEAGGERITGRKIGFTNRTMWKAFGVEAPVWGYTTSRTTHELANAPVMSLSGFSEPRIEPEIVFGLRSAPELAMSDGALIDCVEWIALGYEIVQSMFPGWKFSAADTVAANGLHGALLIGPRHPIAPRRKKWQRELSTFRIDLRRDGALVQRGGGALVLDSPLNALRHLAELLANDPCNPPLRPGEIVSTGTLTLAMPVKPGEHWTAKPEGIPLEEISIRFG